MARRRFLLFRRFPRLRYGAVLPLLLLAAGLSAREPFFSLELSEDLSVLGLARSKLSDGPGSFPEEREALQTRAAENLLEEARWVFSGRVYGFRFRYVPRAGSWEVEEEFDLEPLFLIPRGAPGLRVDQVIEETDRLTVRFSYWPDEGEKKRTARYRNSGYAAAGGRGGAALMQEGAREEAMRQAVKLALREDLRRRFYNRPREAAGFVTFSHSPQLRIAAGEYRASVRILYDLQDLRDYPSR